MIGDARHGLRFPSFSFCGGVIHTAGLWRTSPRPASRLGLVVFSSAMLRLTGEVNMPELKEQIAEVEKELQAERVAANQAKKPSEKVTHLRAVKRLYAKLAKLQIAGVVRAERASKVESAKLRTQRSHFMFIVMGELLRKARGEEGIRSIITRAVAGIEKPKEKDKATKMLALLQEDWSAPAPKPKTAAPSKPQEQPKR